MRFDCVGKSFEICFVNYGFTVYSRVYGVSVFGSPGTVFSPRIYPFNAAEVNGSFINLPFYRYGIAFAVFPEIVSALDFDSSGIFARVYSEVFALFDDFHNRGVETFKNFGRVVFKVYFLTRIIDVFIFVHFGRGNTNGAYIPFYFVRVGILQVNFDVDFTLAVIYNLITVLVKLGSRNRISVIIYYVARVISTVLVLFVIDKRSVFVFNVFAVFKSVFYLFVFDKRSVFLDVKVFVFKIMFFVVQPGVVD